MASGHVEEVRDPTLDERAGRAVGRRDDDVLGRSRRKGGHRGAELVVVDEGDARGRYTSDGERRRVSEVRAGDGKGRASRVGSGYGVDREDDALRKLGCVAVGVGRGDRDARSRLRLRRERFVECRVAVRVGRHLRGAEVRLALDELPREVGTGGIREKVEIERRRGRAVELADDPRARALRSHVLDRPDDREVLQVVEAGVGVARVVSGRADDAEEVDAEGTVVVNRVAADRVAGAGWGFPEHGTDVVECDDVGFSWRGAPDGVVVRIAYSDEGHALHVAERAEAVPLRTDEVALDHVPRGRDEESDVSRGRDDVASAGGRSPDDVVARVDNDRVLFVAQGQGAAGIGAEEIAFDVIPAGIQDDRIVEAIDHQASHRAPPGADIQPGLPCDGAAHLDQERAVEAGGVGVRGGPRLAVTIDRHGVGDHGERRCGRDRVDAGSGDVESDDVEAANCHSRRRSPGGAIPGQYRLCSSR